MHILIGSVSDLLDRLERIHSKKSPFVIVVSTADRCERVREEMRSRFGKDVTPGRFYRRTGEDNFEWIVATPSDGVPSYAGSCAIEDGMLNTALRWQDEKLRCVAIMHVYWVYSRAPAPSESLVEAIWRRARKFTFWGGFAFLAMFIVAWVFGP